MKEIFVLCAFELKKVPKMSEKARFMSIHTNLKPCGHSEPFASLEFNEPG